MDGLNFGNYRGFSKSSEDPSKLIRAIKLLSDDDRIEINNELHSFFVSNIDRFSVIDSREILYILSARSNPKFRKIPISYLVDNYHNLSDDLTSLLTELSENENTVTKIQIAKSITKNVLLTKESAKRLPDDTLEILLSNLFIHEDRLHYSEVLELLLELFLKLDSNIIRLILKKVLDSDVAEYNQFYDIISKNLKYIPNDIVVQILWDYIEDNNIMNNFNAIVIIEKILEDSNYIYDENMSKEDLYDLIEILKSYEFDGMISNIAKSRFS